MTNRAGLDLDYGVGQTRVTDPSGPALTDAPRPDPVPPHPGAEASVSPGAITTEEIVGRSLWQNAWGRLLHNKAAVIGMIVLALVTVFCVAGPWVAHYTFDEVDWENIATPPSVSNGHYFGTEENGRDVMVRTMYGGRVSLMVGLTATLVSLVIGVGWGALAGFMGGRVDAVMMRFVDVLYSLPYVFFVILLTVVFSRSLLLIFVGLGAVQWLDMARIVRGQTLSLKRKEFIEAAIAGGVSTTRIITRHIIPNTLGPVAVYVTLTVPQVILLESFISFLGLGVQEPYTSWGVLISDGARSMQTSVWMLYFPATLLAITLFSFNFVGDGMRDALDPKDR